MDLTISVGADGHSRLTSRHVAFPWSLGRGYSGGMGKPVMLIPQTAGAGLLAGDEVHQRLQVNQDSSLHLHSAGAMLTHGTPEGAASISNWDIGIENGARALLLSEPYVLLANASLILRQRITLGDGAKLVMCEGIISASDPVSNSWETETRIARQDGDPVFIDRQRATSESLRLHNSMGTGWTAFGTVLILAPDIARIQELTEKALAQLDGTASWIGVAPMPGNLGIAIRIAAKTGQTLRETMLSLAKQSFDML